MAIDIDLPFVPSGSALGERTTRKQRNPSARHQALLEAMKLFPETPLRLVAPDLQLGYSAEGSIEARTGDTDAYGLEIDARIEYYDRGKVVLGLIVEVQLGGEEDLSWRIPPYVGYVKHDCRCATDILILCERRTTAKNLSGPVMIGARDNRITPKSIGPDDISPAMDLAEAAAEPGRLLLATWYHIGDGTGAGEKLMELLARVTALLDEIDAAKAERYYDLALAILPAESARRYREMTEINLREWVAKEYFPDIRNPALEEGRREGREQEREESRKRLQEAQAQSILTVLSIRKLIVPAEIRKMIMDCRDLDVLRTWLERAVTASSAIEVITAA
jgi:hypothetical protein